MYLQKEIPTLFSAAVINIKGSIFGFLQAGCKIPYSVRNMRANTSQDPWETLLRWQWEVQLCSPGDIKNCTTAKMTPKWSYVPKPPLALCRATLQRLSVVVKSPENGEPWQRRAQGWGESALKSNLVIHTMSMLDVISAKTQWSTTYC